MELLPGPAHPHSGACAGNDGDLNASRVILLLIVLGKACGECADPAGLAIPSIQRDIPEE